MKIYTKEQKDSWVKWVTKYGLGDFLEAFIHNVEGAENTCIHCGKIIHVSIMEGGGIPEWSTSDGDYGCVASPETCEEGVGSHMPGLRN